MTARIDTTLSAEQRAELAKHLAVEQRPISDVLLTAVAKGVASSRRHKHPTGGEPDGLCTDHLMWAGRQAGPLIRRILDAETEIERLRAELATRPPTGTIPASEQVAAQREAIREVMRTGIERAQLNGWDDRKKGFQRELAGLEAHWASEGAGATPTPVEQRRPQVATNAFEQAASGLLGPQPAGTYTLSVCAAPQVECMGFACRTSSVRAAGTLEDMRTAARESRHAWVTDHTGTRIPEPMTTVVVPGALAGRLWRRYLDDIRSDALPLWDRANSALYETLEHTESDLKGAVTIDVTTAMLGVLDDLAHTIREDGGDEEWAQADKRAARAWLPKSEEARRILTARYAPGDRVVCADGVTRVVECTVTRPGEPDRVRVEGGQEWIADNCTRALPAEDAR